MAEDFGLQLFKFESILVVPISNAFAAIPFCTYSKAVAQCFLEISIVPGARSRGAEPQPLTQRGVSWQHHFSTLL
jgi:hypothetical protein